MNSHISTIYIILLHLLYRITIHPLSLFLSTRLSAKYIGGLGILPPKHYSMHTTSKSSVCLQVFLLI